MNSVIYKQMKLIKQYVLNSSAANSNYGKELVLAIDERLEKLEHEEYLVRGINHQNGLMPTFEELEEIS